MKLFTLLVILVMFEKSAVSQEKTFIRLYDFDKHKFHKGKLSGISDSSISVEIGKKTIIVPVYQIGSICLRRSVGHAIFMSSVVMAAVLVPIGAATAHPDEWFGYTSTQGAIGGFALGALHGTWIGALIGRSRKKPFIQINGSLETWAVFKPIIAGYVVNTQSE